MEAISIESDQFFRSESFSREDNEFFDSWVDLVSSVLQAPIVGISMLFDGKMDLLAQKGFRKNSFFSREDTFCHYTLKQSDCFVVKDAILDPRFRDSFLVENSPYIVSYAGIPLYHEKLGKIGTLFIADSGLREFSQDALNKLRVFTKQLQSILSDKIDKTFLLKKEYEQMRSLKHFVHDLKNPMAIIKVSLDMMKNNGEERGDSQRLMNRCQRSLNRTLMSIDEFLRNDKFSVECDPSLFKKIDLKPFIFSTVNELNYFMSHEQRIVCDIDNFTIKSDHSLVKRIIDNLITNAVKYGDGSIITISTSTQSKYLLISVSDEGIGLSTEDKDKIFSFGHKKGHSTLSSHGIGLHFCKFTAQKLGGDLYVEDNLPRGAKFTLKLPL